MFNGERNISLGAANKASPEAAGPVSLARRLARSLTAEETGRVSGIRVGDANAGGSVVKPDISD